MTAIDAYKKRDYLQMCRKHGKGRPFALACSQRASPPGSAHRPREREHDDNKPSQLLELSLDCARGTISLTAYNNSSGSSGGGCARYAKAASFADKGTSTTHASGVVTTSAASP